MGKKPLFYSGNGIDGFLWGSSANALHHAGIKRSFDPQSLPSLLAFGTVRAPRSIYSDIEQVPPATMMVVEEGK
jgi:asparagine synthase (glutamine-hydrolysing)